ncbi:DUF4113 domain-containing protein [Granulicella sibirica]|uniref:Error-prone, lesion bypass DNA polymerase V (UmuC) n=1 Tax=Granulicella sibirica TaxID=2479048 RepID=A0A4Q0STD6_9BACT|nr:Error-prone, lesion bypass DNA polymerase V (UmuC) [Granulicella sibirica]
MRSKNKGKGSEIRIASTRIYLRILGAGPKNAAWKLRAEHRSPRWATRWDELPRVRSN